MENTLFIGTVNMFNSNNSEADKNGLMPMIIEPICGPCPNQRVLAGTIAKNLGLIEGNTYMFKFTRLEDDPEYGARYSFTKIAQPDVLQIMQASDILGPARLIGKNKDQSEE